MDTKPILLASSGTREGMQKLIREFYCSPSADFDGRGYVTNGTRILENTHVVIRKGRYRLESK